MADRTNYKAATVALNAATTNIKEPNVDVRNTEGAQAIATIGVGRAILALVDELKRQNPPGSGEPMYREVPR